VDIGSSPPRLLPRRAVLEVTAVDDRQDPLVDEPGNPRSIVETMDNEESEEQHLGRGARAIVGGEQSIVLLRCRDH
jgi:hypothetical protein